MYCPFDSDQLEALQVFDIFSFILHLAAHWLLMAHFQQTVTWVGLELEGAGVIREGGVSKGGGVTRSGWEIDIFTITGTVWA